MSLFDIEDTPECASASGKHSFDLAEAEGNMWPEGATPPVNYLRLWWECQHCRVGRVITYSMVDGVWMPVMMKERQNPKEEYVEVSA